MPRARLLALAVVILASGCGSSSGGGTSSTHHSGGGSAGHGDTLPAAAQAALTPSASDFPAPRGRSLQKLAESVKPGAQVGLSAQTYVPGAQRLPFALLDKGGKFLYGPTAVYVATDPNKPARGPYLAPGDSLVVDPANRSKTSGADPEDIKLIYEARVPLPKTGSYAVLAVTRVGGRLVGGASQIKVTRSSPIPDRGARPPAVSTDTKGKTSVLTTRIPPDEMHAVSFSDVLGRKPVALLFATPALCQSRVCGPVTDIMVQLQKRYGSRIAFVHQEVYRENNPNKGLRSPLEAFHLQTEPWLFVVDRHGRVAARLEGAFGLREGEQALRAALR